MALRVLIAGGGTGGHVIPGLAIGRELRERHGAEVRFVGTARGLEAKLVPEAGFALELIRVGQLNNVSLRTRVRTLGDLPLGILRCVRLVREFRPNIVVGVGGYASGPTMLAAILLRVPTLAFEPNAIPGLTNRLVVKRVCEAAVDFGNARVTVIPVRKEFFKIAPRTHGPPRLLVFGGSQGARVLNESMPSLAVELLEEFDDLTIVHQAGGRQIEKTLAGYAETGIAFQRLRVQPYLEEMVEEIAAADVVLCRSGASTVAELAAAGRAAVLVPFAAAADDHQRKNAEALVNAGAARMVLEGELTLDRLLKEISGLLKDGESRIQMARAAHSLSNPGAAAVIAKMCVEFGRTGQHA